MIDADDCANVTCVARCVYDAWSACVVIERSGGAVVVVCSVEPKAVVGWGVVATV